MGVAGAGKTLIGSQLAATLGIEFVEGDEYHPVANVAKMLAAMEGMTGVLDVAILIARLVSIRAADAPGGNVSS